MIVNQTEFIRGRRRIGNDAADLLQTVLDVRRCLGRSLNGLVDLQAGVVD